jgi:dihydropteroate synthase
MATTEYIRPLGFVLGHDARKMISQGAAGSLGGSKHIAFTHVEVFTRTGTNGIYTYNDVSGVEAVERIRAVRPPLGGLDLSACRVMGIVNVTPDSFSDGGLHGEFETAIAHGRKLAVEGADILDIGGESTRPGSDTVLDNVEIARVIPVVEALAIDHLVSIDTRKPGIMKAASDAGAALINDVSALRYSSDSLAVAAATGKPVILMHSQGEPRTMQLKPIYQSVVLDVYDHLLERVEACVAAGIDRSRICVDPGIGFGKSFEHNLALMQGLAVFLGLGVALLVGVSRKNMIGVLTGEKVPANRVSGSIGGAMQAALHGAHIVRVHDVAATVQAFRVFTVSQDPDLAAV